MSDLNSRNEQAFREHDKWLQRNQEDEDDLQRSITEREERLRDRADYERDREKDERESDDSFERFNEQFRDDES